MNKTFKTLLSFIIVITLAVSMFAVNVSAASATISGAGEYEVGKSFNVTVRFNADATLYAVEADISYNSSVLRLNSVSGADYNAGNGTVKIVDDGFSATKPSKTSSYTLNFTAIAAGNSNISVSLLGGGEAESSASASAAVKVITPKPSSNANLASIKLSSGSLSPAFNANTTNYTATVKYSVDSITITGAVADGGATYVGGGTFALQVGDNSRVLTVTAADGSKKSYTINIKRMTEQETADAEQAERDANPLLVIIDGVDYTIVNNLEGVAIPAGFTQGTATRKESEITVLNDDAGKYQLCWLVDANGENGAFYRRDENDNFTKLVYINTNGKMYIVEDLGDYGTMPQGFILSRYSIDGTEIDAITYEDENLTEFYVLNCYVGSSTGYYRFDTIEGTMQRAADFDAALIAANSEDPIEQPSGKFAWFIGMSKTGKAVFIIIVAVAAIIIALGVILIIKIASARSEDDFYDDEMTANEFVLNDFADEMLETPDFEIQPQSVEDEQSVDDSTIESEQKD